jgi:hypothetical protein
MRGISYALFSVAAWGTNYLAAGGVDSVAMSIAIATLLLFLMARFPPYRGAARRLALLGLLGVASFNLLFYSYLAYVTAALFVVLESPATQLLETALTWRRPGSLAAVAGGLPHLGAVAIRPQPPPGYADHPDLGRVYRIDERHASAVQPCRGQWRGSPSSVWPPCRLPPPSPGRKPWPIPSSSP